MGLPTTKSRPSVPRNGKSELPSGAVVLKTDTIPCGQCLKEVPPGIPVMPPPKGGMGYLCPDCAGYGDLHLLPSGDVALTRRAAKLSRRSFPVVAWSPRGKRWERRGTMVELRAVDEAEIECAIDSERRAAAREKARAREVIRDAAYVQAFAQAIQTHFPAMPPGKAEAIAIHACEKHSGRVGRTGAAKEFDEEMITLAVVAHIRHCHTDYDSLLDQGLRKRAGRQQVRDDIQDLLVRWRRKPTP